MKKERNVLRSFAKEQNILGFFYVLCKRTLPSLRSFTFFAKERCLLCFLLRSYEKNAKERIVLLGLISRQKLEKKNVKERCVIYKNRKGRFVQNGKERGAQPWF